MQSAEDFDEQGWIWETSLVPGDLGGQGDVGGEVCRGEVLWNSGNCSSKQGLADGEIWSRSSSTFKNSNEKEGMSERLVWSR
jgi:hypothetical protein